MKILSNIKHDKLLHFFYGSIISFISVLIFGVNGLWITVAIAAAKEIIWDYLMKKGNAELLDFVYTIIPAAMLFILCS